MKLSCTIILFLLMTSSVGHAEKQCLILGALPHARHAEISQQVSDILNSEGVCNRILFGPEKRLTAHFRNNEIDGELLRIPAYGKSVGDIAFMIKNSYAHAHGLLVVKKKNLTSLGDLQHKTIGIIRGTQWSADAVEELDNVIEVTEYQQLPEMLKFGRISGFLMDEVSWSYMAAEYPDFHTFYVQDLSAHIWLLNEHRGLEEKISSIISTLNLGRLTK